MIIFMTTSVPRVTRAQAGTKPRTEWEEKDGAGARAGFYTATKLHNNPLRSQVWLGGGGVQFAMQMTELISSRLVRKWTDGGEVGRGHGRPAAEQESAL